MTSAYRPVSIVTRTVPGHDAPRFFAVEADGTTMPLNRDGYSRQIGALRAMGRAYDVRIAANGTCSIALSNRRIEPRDEAFVCRLVDHDVAVEQRARSARLDARVAADAEAGAASVARADAAVAAASKPAAPGLPDVASDIYHMLVANRDGGTYEREDGSVWACTYLDNARPAGISAHAYAGHLSALERAGLYRSIGDDAFGDVKLPASAPTAPAPAAPLPCHLIPTPSGRFAFAGRVPTDLAFAASSPDYVATALQCGPGIAQKQAAREGGTFRSLSWATEADAYAYAAGLGYEVPGLASPAPADAVDVNTVNREAQKVHDGLRIVGRLYGEGVRWHVEMMRRGDCVADRGQYPSYAAALGAMTAMQDAAPAPAMVPQPCQQQQGRHIAGGIALTARQIDALKAARDKGGAHYARKGSLMGGAFRRMCEALAERGLLTDHSPFCLTEAGREAIDRIAPPVMVPQPVQQQQARDMRATATPDVSSRYGAPMGRRSATMPNLDPAEKIQLSRIRLNSGGYDAGGAYWGHGAPLWCAMDHTGETAFFRARDRDAAKAHVRDEHDTPEQVRFYR